MQFCWIMYRLSPTIGNPYTLYIDYSPYIVINRKREIIQFYLSLYTAITSPPVILARVDQRLKTPEAGPRWQMKC